MWCTKSLKCILSCCAVPWYLAAMLPLRYSSSSKLLMMQTAELLSIMRFSHLIWSGPMTSCLSSKCVSASWSATHRSFCRKFVLVTGSGSVAKTKNTKCTVFKPFTAPGFAVLPSWQTPQHFAQSTTVLVSSAKPCRSADNQFCSSLPFSVCCMCCLTRSRTLTPVGISGPTATQTSIFTPHARHVTVHLPDSSHQSVTSALAEIRANSECRIASFTCSWLPLKCSMYLHRTM